MGARFSSPLHKLLRSAKKKKEEEDEEVKWLRRKWIFIRLIKPWGFVYDEDGVTREGMSRVGISSLRSHVPTLYPHKSKSFCALYMCALRGVCFSSRHWPTKPERDVRSWEWTPDCARLTVYALHWSKTDTIAKYPHRRFYKAQKECPQKYNA